MNSPSPNPDTGLNESSNIEWDKLDKASADRVRARTIPGESRTDRKRRMEKEAETWRIAHPEYEVVQAIPAPDLDDAASTKIRDAMNTVWRAVAIPVSFKNPNAAKILAYKGPPITEATLEVARQDAKFRKQLLKAVSVSAYGSLAVAVLGLLVPLAASYGLLPLEAAGLFGIELVPMPVPEEENANTPQQHQYSGNGLGGVPQQFS